MERIAIANIEETISAPGEVTFRRVIPLAFVTGGRLSSILVNEGDYVRANQPLARLDTTVLDVELERARSELQRRTNELRRIQELFDDGWVTLAQLEETQNAQALAATAARTAEFNRDGSILKASGPGVVLARLTEPGQVLPLGSPVLSWGDVSGGYILRVLLSDTQVQRIELGAPAQVTIKAIEGMSLSGQVVELGAQAESRSKSFAVEISLPPSTNLRPGQIGNATISVRSSPEPEDVTLVPANALFDARGGQGFLYLLDPETDRVRLQRVEIGEPVGSAVKVTSGLQANAWVVVSNLEQIQDGMIVDADKRGL